MPYAKNDNTKIYYEEHGSGEPLLLIMGLGYTLDMWHRTAPRLAERYRVIRFDNRGVGRSDVATGPYSPALLAEDALAVLDAANISRAHVFGISMGGFIAQELALRHPERLRSLILGCTHHGGPHAVMPGPAVLSMFGVRATLPKEAAVRLMVPYLYDASTPAERIEEDLVIRLEHFPTAEGYLAQLQGVLGFESRTRLGQLRMPTLIVHGEHDGVVPAANAHLLVDAIPGARLAMLENASHIFFTDQPDRTHQAVSEFLQGVRAPAG
jgi:pimeloyl-ACP methyl ester carboxylesterase